MTRRRLVAIPVAVAALALSGCPEPPSGLLSALQRAMMGKLMCDIEGRCSGTNELNLGVGDSLDDIKAKFARMTAPWCPTWSIEADPIALNQRARLRKQSSYSVNLAGFGIVRMSSGDFEAEIEARTTGWKTTVKHEQHARVAPAPATCPDEWPRAQCKFRPSVEWEATADVALTWVERGETFTGSASAGDVLTYQPGTPIEWCTKARHGGERMCGAEDGSGTEPRTCSSHEDCRGLPCGEYICEGGQCTAVESAPDGTACTGGACKGGTCVPR